MRMSTTTVLLPVLLALVLTSATTQADEHRLLRFTVWDETDRNPIPHGEGWVDGFQRPWLFAEEKDRSFNAWMGDHKLLVYILDSDDEEDILTFPLTVTEETCDGCDRGVIQITVTDHYVTVFGEVVKAATEEYEVKKHRPDAP